MPGPPELWSRQPIGIYFIILCQCMSMVVLSPFRFPQESGVVRGLPLTKRGAWGAWSPCRGLGGVPQLSLPSLLGGLGPGPGGYGRRAMGAKRWIFRPVLWSIVYRPSPFVL